MKMARDGDTRASLGTGYVWIMLLVVRVYVGSGLKLVQGPYPPASVGHGKFSFMSSWIRDAQCARAIADRKSLVQNVHGLECSA